MKKEHIKEKINIAQLIKDCPKGMELDCTMFLNTVYLKDVILGDKYSIVIKTKNSGIITLTDYGTYVDVEDAKCVIFPKGKTTWEGFVPPCTFKDGDIIFTGADSMKIGLGNTWISIFEENRNGGVATYVDYCNEGENFYTYLEDKGLLCMKEDIIQQRLATEEEKQRIFQAIKDNGYKWNPESKTLEKLPKFKVGDEISKRNSISNSWIVCSVSSEYYGLKLPNGSENIGVLPIEEQDDWELVPDKFDINTLKPFDKVLVRDNNAQKWTADLFSLFDKSLIYPYSCVGHYTNQCIPYEGNEHLLGTSNDCDDYYKTWEE